MKCHNCKQADVDAEGLCPECGVYSVKVPMSDCVFIFAKGQLPDPFFPVCRTLPRETLRALQPGSVICYHHIPGVPPPRFVVFAPEKEQKP